MIAPLSFYPTLAGATPRQRRAWEFWGDEGKGGYAVEWPDLDLQLSIESIVAGRREHVPPPGFYDWLRKSQREQGMELPRGVTWAMVEKNPRRDYWR